ncbi:glucose-6-phosphate dehydrogenase, partial [Limosilactobacillus fermentum]
MAKENKAVITLFGATGDLAQRKLYPSLFNLYQKGYLAEHFALLGTSRRPVSDEEFQAMVEKSISGIDEVQAGNAQAFAKHFFYQSHDVT